MKDKISVAQSLRRIREHLGLSRAQVAKGVCHQSLINLIENGHRSPSLFVLGGLAESLACEPNDLLSNLTEERLDQIKVNYEVRAAQAVLDRHNKAGAA